MAFTEWKMIKVKELRRKYCNRREGEQLRKKNEYYTKHERMQSAIITIRKLIC